MQTNATSPAHTRRGAGFTLMELLASLGVIFLLLGILIAGIYHVRGAAASAVDATTVNSLKMAVDQFKQELGMLPPLVKDWHSQGPLDTAGTRPHPRVYLPSDPDDLAFLRRLPPGDEVDERFSVYSLPYYVLGVLGADADGVEGPGFAEVNRDGTFKVRKLSNPPSGQSPWVPSGRRFEPFFDVGPSAVVAIDAAAGKLELRDRGGVPIRFYRWLPDAGDPPADINNYNDPNDASQASGLRKFLNTPWMVGDPEASEAVRSATYAIVAAGPDGLFGNEFELRTDDPHWISEQDMRTRLGIGPDESIFEAASADNIVVVGR